MTHHSSSNFLSSSIGRKYTVAITGLLLLGFIIFHLLGNLSIFLGPEMINSYSQHLRDLGPLLWVARISLLVIVTLHIYFTMLLWRENKQAHPEKYAVKQHLETTVYARSMRLSGLVILSFVLFHLAQFTWKWLNPEYQTWLDVEGHHDVYRMLMAAFSNPWVVGFYFLSVGFLAMHLSHGIGSLFQTLGLSTEKLRKRFQRAGLIVAWVFFLGYASIPVSLFLKNLH
ncbi:MAG: succinate dehydrogenase cytochrome b subunit [Chthoniobacterales bacterium]